MLTNKTAFITGATSGFGQACARAMAACGARLVLCGRRGDRLSQLAQELNQMEVHCLTLDVRHQQEVDDAIHTLPASFQAIDMLVNNAGLALGLSSFDKAELADAQQMIDTNIAGLVYCTRAILPGMVERNSGHIVNMGSVAGTYPYPGGNVYGATKAFVAQFSLNLRADLLGTGIRVTNIEPGMAETEFSLVRFHGDSGKAGAVYEGVHSLTAQDVADAVLWCVSRPAHVNINRMELMPTQQAFSPFAVKRS